MPKFTFIDLFSGIGGFHKALVDLGGECLAFSEIHKDAIETYCINHYIAEDKNLGDIRKINDLPQHDVLVAGVPCQSWSIAGKNLGFDDDRGQLWNDTLHLLKQSKPQAFIFENVKGLADPRNRKALAYILKRVKEAGYFAKHYLLNSYDFGVLQNRERVYIIGFKDPSFHHQFRLLSPPPHHKKLGDILDGVEQPLKTKKTIAPKDLFGNHIPYGRTKFQKINQFNDFFTFNDIRNGHTTVHSWDLIETTEREKQICLLLLKNRRKKRYGSLDGNPLALEHFQQLDGSIQKEELETLVQKGILKEVAYQFKIIDVSKAISEKEKIFLENITKENIRLDILKQNRALKINKIKIKDVLKKLTENNVIEPTEIRYEFKFTKISSGIFGINRVFLPTSDIYGALVASDNNDYVATKNITAHSKEDFKQKFISDIYQKEAFRKISKEEACKLQGFPTDFILPETRSRWMKLLGNSVSIPVIEHLVLSILKTGIFENEQVPSNHIQQLISELLF